MDKSILGSNYGYSFIELLVAISILGLVTAPFLALFSGSHLFINSAGRQSTAVNLCRARIEEVKSLGCSTARDLYLNNDGSSPITEESVEGFNRFRRVTDLRPFYFSCENQPATELTLLVITVTVYWEEGNAGKSETLSVLFSCREWK